MKVVIEDWELESLTQQREAWYDVVEVLREFKPRFMQEKVSGSECAVRAIRELARGDLS